MTTQGNSVADSVTEPNGGAVFGATNTENHNHVIWQELQGRSQTATDQQPETELEQAATGDGDDSEEALARSDTLASSDTKEKPEDDYLTYF